MRFKVYFETKVQTDGFTNRAKDLDYQLRKEIIIVNAKNEKSAIIVACRKSFGYFDGWKCYHKWHKGQVKRIKILK